MPPACDEASCGHNVPHARLEWQLSSAGSSCCWHRAGRSSRRPGRAEDSGGYATATRAEYVFACMATNGGTPRGAAALLLCHRRDRLRAAVRQIREGRDRAAHAPQSSADTSTRSSAARPPTTSYAISRRRRPRPKSAASEAAGDRCQTRVAGHSCVNVWPSLSSISARKLVAPLGW